jgi:predicted 3-demethylubiquinone-9 3-methyltransferase (glyoxalase superfamily)
VQFCSKARRGNLPQYCPLFARLHENATMAAMTPSKITPCLWFNFNAEEAVHYYLSIFKRSRIVEISHYGDALPALKGKVLTIQFEIEGARFLALNGGPQFPFTEAIP